MLEFKVEKLDECLDEMKPLLEDHWEEIAIYRDKIKLNFDEEKYRFMEKAGTLHIVTARDKGELVGYFVSFIVTHMHYSDHTYAMNDILFLLPDYRHAGNAADMFGYAEDRLKELGVSVISLHMKVEHPFHTLSDYLGYDRVEYNYSKYIGD